MSNIDKAAEHLGANALKMIKLILLKHDAAIIEASQEAIEAAVLAEREACAKVCDDQANRCEKAAQSAIEDGEHDEVSAIRSTAWKISVCAAAIRARGQA